jgi:RimJ/RimL family protein N-acetyltransferase
MPEITLARSNPDPDGDDSRCIWIWRNDPLTRQMSVATDEIPWERHRAWYAQAVRDPQKVLLLARVEGQPLAMVRFDRGASDEAEVSINLNPALRGRGLAQPLLAAACAWGFRELDLARITARIKPENARSLRVFAAVGFVPAGSDGVLPMFALVPPAR